MESILHSTPLLDTEGISQGRGQWGDVAPVVRNAFVCILSQLPGVVGGGGGGAMRSRVVGGDRPECGVDVTMVAAQVDALRHEVADLRTEVEQKANASEVYSAEEVKALTVKILRAMDRPVSGSGVRAEPSDLRGSGEWASGPQRQAPSSLSSSSPAELGTPVADHARVASQVHSLRAELEQLREQVAKQQHAVAVGGLNSIIAAENSREIYQPIRMEMEEIRVDLAELKQTKADASFCRDKFAEMNLHLGEEKLGLRTTAHELEERMAQQLNTAMAGYTKQLKSEVAFLEKKLKGAEDTLASGIRAVKEDCSKLLEAHRKDTKLLVEAKFLRRERDAQSQGPSQLELQRDRILQEIKSKNDEIVTNLQRSIESKAEKLEEMANKKIKKEVAEMKESVTALIAEAKDFRSAGGSSQGNSSNMSDYSHSNSIPKGNMENSLASGSLASFSSSRNTDGARESSGAGYSPRGHNDISQINGFLMELRKTFPPGQLSRDFLRASFLPAKTDPRSTPVDVTEDIIEQTRLSFSRAVRRADGSLTPQEVVTLLGSWGLQPTPYEMNCITAYVKPNAASPLLFNEFLHFYAVFYYYTRLRDSWKQYQAASLDPAALAALLLKLGLVASPGEISGVMRSTGIQPVAKFESFAAVVFGVLQAQRSPGPFRP